MTEYPNWWWSSCDSDWELGYDSLAEYIADAECWHLPICEE